MSEWIAVDLDGTLAFYEEFKGPLHIGPPIKLMLQRVRKWLDEGLDVRIFTARVGPNNPLGEGLTMERIVMSIQDWCELYLGRRLPVTCTKDYHMKELWDDRCVQVIPNTGMRADGRA